MTKDRRAGVGSPPAPFREPLAITPTDVAPVIALIQRNPAEGAALTQSLLRAAQAIFDADCAASAIPPRRALAQRLASLKEAAEVVATLVLDPSIQAVAPGIHETFGASEGLDVPSAMGRLVRVVQRQLKRLDKAQGQKGPKSAASLFGRHSPRLLCATVIVEAWRRLRGRRPAATTETAQLACAELWRAAGGRPTDAVKQGAVLGGEGASWERHLKHARKLNPENPEHAFVLQQAANIFTPGTRTNEKT